MDRPHYVTQLIELWGEPRVAIDEPRRFLGPGYTWKLGWTWFPGMVNHSISLRLDGSYRTVGLWLSCHDQDCLQIEVFHPSRALMPVEIAAFITMAGWQSAHLK